jgi:proteic killer suppression protein
LRFVPLRGTNIKMIISFRHKGLETLYRTGSISGVRGDHVGKLRRILAMLDVAQAPTDMSLPGYHLHPLKGRLKDHWAISVTGNWRVIWRFKGADVEVVDYVDYH